MWIKMWVIFPGSVSTDYHAEFQDWQFGFYDYTRNFTKDTALSQDGRGTARHV
jgi:hypothetical protein